MKKQIKDIIINKINSNRVVKSSDIVKETGFSRVYVNRAFRELIAANIIKRIGKANNTCYVLFNSVIKTNEVSYILNNTNLDEDNILSKALIDFNNLVNLNANVLKIFKFAFAEMLNNAIEHSKAKKIKINISINNDILSFDIDDNGIGIFNNIIKKFKFNKVDDAIEFILKGKKTTAKEKHSGQGIFFTSKMADKFIIFANDRKVVFDNNINDISLISHRSRKGTKIRFEININSKKQTIDIFNKYSDTESFKFNKTDIAVKLYEYNKNGMFISRSEARRILIGVEDFDVIVLDFKNIDAVGQGFADQIFRIFRKENPDKTIEFKNTNKDVEFMIKRALID